MFTRRDYQTDAHQKIKAALLSGKDLMVVSPTGSGKSLVLIDVLTDPDLRGIVLTVPSVEIGLGVYLKLPGADPTLPSQSEKKQQARLEACGIFTIKRLHNLLLQGAIAPPRFLLHDEGHHSVDNTHDVVHAVCGHCPRACVTATAYRGTPDETAKLRQAWGEPYVALNLKDAVARGVIAKPDFRVWPLVNDDEIAVRDGEFVLSSTEAAIEEQLPALCERVRTELCDADGRPYRPTMIRCPGVKSALAVAHALRSASVPAVCITGSAVDGAPGESRQKALARVVACEAVLVQVRVVGEGVDLPMRVMVDLAPTISPVLWQQSVGRITRPVGGGGHHPLYIATNHNLSRHAYLWEGLIPLAQIRDAQKAWGPDYKPTRKHLARALGLEGFGKFVVTQVLLKDGSYASLYALQTKDGMHLYAVLVHPCMSEPWYFEKQNTATGRRLTKDIGGGRTVEYNEKKYGPWRKIDRIPSAEGYITVKPGPATQGMLDFWQSAAEGRGLDPNHVPDWRQFQALPMLLNTRSRFNFTEGE